MLYQILLFTFFYFDLLFPLSDRYRWFLLSEASASINVTVSFALFETLPEKQENKFCYSGKHFRLVNVICLISPWLDLLREKNAVMMNQR